MVDMVVNRLVCSRLRDLPVEIDDDDDDDDAQDHWMIALIAAADVTSFGPRGYSWARTRGTQLSAGYTVNTYSKRPLYDASKCGNVTRCLCGHQ